MRTNTRHMTAEQRAAALAADIAADHAANVAYDTKFRATVAMWRHADAAGLTPAERHALDMALRNGVDPAFLSTTF